MHSNGITCVIKSFIAIFLYEIKIKVLQSFPKGNISKIASHACRSLYHIFWYSNFYAYR